VQHKAKSGYSKTKFPDSDVETNTDPIIENKRKLNQNKRRQIMRQRLQGRHLDDHYYPDDQDEAWERRLLLAPAQNSSAKMRGMRNKIPSPTRRRMGMGFIVTGENAKF